MSGGEISAKTPTYQTQKIYRRHRQKYLDMKAFVVYGAPCHGAMADTVEDLKCVGMYEEVNGTNVTPDRK